MSSISDRQVFKEVCENSFSFFVRQYLKVVEPETVFQWNWHMDVLCHHCEMVYYGDIQNLDINIPPRQLKSLIISVLFPCWIWTKRPSFKILAASRSFDLSTKFNTKRRDLIENEAYRSMWPIPLKDDANTTTRFVNEYNGFMQAASAGGKIVGEGADLLLSDDLLDTMDSFSRSKREAVCNWYSNAFYNRAQNKKTVKRININQRLHVMDVSGHLSVNHNFKKLVLPMQMTEKPMSTVDFVDPRKPGEFLHPERYGEEEKEDDFKGLGVYGWSSQMQQNPRPIGGGIIKEEWIRYYDVMPAAFDKKIITADLSFKGNQDSDFVCFQAWGKIGPLKYLIDIVRGKWSYKVTKDKFKAFCEKHDINLKYVEDKANGPALISDLSDDITGINAWPSEDALKKADKVQRLHLVSAEFENGNVYIPKNLEIIEAYVDELTSFTEKGSATGNDDMVDTSTMGLLELKKSNTFFGA